MTPSTNPARDEAVREAFAGLSLSEDAKAYWAVRGEAWRKVFAVLRDYRMTNMRDDIGGGYPLVDLMSNDGKSIATGQEEMVHLADEISATLDSAPAPASGVDAVAVKPLEWNGPTAETPFGDYSVGDFSMTDDPEWYWTRGGYPYPARSDESFLSDADAKAAAQADYEQRILSALSPAAASGSDEHHPDFDDGYQWARNAMRNAVPTSGSEAGGELRKALEAARNTLRDIERARASYGATGHPVGLYSTSAASWMENRAEAGAEAADAALAKPSSPAAREDIAKIVYAAMKWAAERAENGRPPEWVERGNSTAQDEARRFASDIAALSPSTSAAEPVAWQWRWQFNETGWSRWEMGEPTEYVLSTGFPVERRPLYAHPAPAAVESAQGVKEQGFVDGYEAAMRDVNVFRVKIAEPFDSSFDTIKVFVFDMLKRNAEKLRASLATEKEG